MNHKEADDTIVLLFFMPASQSPVAGNIGLSETGTHASWRWPYGNKDSCSSITF